MRKSIPMPTIGRRSPRSWRRQMGWGVFWAFIIFYIAFYFGPDLTRAFISPDSYLAEYRKDGRGLPRIPVRKQPAAATLPGGDVKMAGLGVIGADRAPNVNGKQDLRDPLSSGDQELIRKSEENRKISEEILKTASKVSEAAAASIERAETQERIQLAESATKSTPAEMKKPKTDLPDYEHHKQNGFFLLQRGKFHIISPGQTQSFTFESDVLFWSGKGRYWGITEDRRKYKEGDVNVDLHKKMHRSPPMLIQTKGVFWTFRNDGPKPLEIYALP
ncbi:hypothetical protein HYW53_03775 [Candidatus Giovannonibacteria bacterium]|nr:hypothetical protein [Candidatus Giovannonibacteria bacterium]